MIQKNGKRELGIYLHIPFCVQKCRYCDFLSFPADDETREQYVRMLIRETETFFERQPKLQGIPWTVTSIFLGGGTPSVLKTGQIARILDAVRAVFPVQPDAEVTIECNPGTGPDLEGFLRAGINRLSLGVQSASNAELAALGRIHTWEEAEAAVGEARRAGFENISADLIFSLPGQSLESWRDTLDKTADLQVEHISAYSLIIEEGTPFYALYHEDDERRSQGDRPLFLPDEDTERAMFRETERLLRERGYERYEISNYAKPGYRSIHNTGYWIRREYAGLGLGASSQTGNRRTRNTGSMKEYLAGSFRPAEDILLSDRDACSEAVFLGLRMTEGIDLEEFERRYHFQAEKLWPGVIGDMIGKGLMVREKNRIRLTERGTDLSNYVFSEFV